MVDSRGKLLHLKLAEIFEASGEMSKVEDIFSRALKKPQYKKSKKVWAAYQAFRLRSGDGDGAKELLKRSMQSLSRHKHIEVITKYAITEFDIGSEDRGRVVFEDLLASFPKRLDLWHVYLDQEIKRVNTRQARHIFERMISMKMKNSAQSIKNVFKKYLEFETKHGDESSQAGVKQKARDYVASLM